MFINAFIESLWKQLSEGWIEFRSYFFPFYSPFCCFVLCDSVLASVQGNLINVAERTDISRFLPFKSDYHLLFRNYNLQAHVLSETSSPILTDIYSFRSLTMCWCFKPQSIIKARVRLYFELIFILLYKYLQCFMAWNAFDINSE